MSDQNTRSELGNMNKSQSSRAHTRTHRTGMRRSATYIRVRRFAMLKIAVIVFALAVSGFMLWIAHEDANFAQLPHATFVKRAV
jgi:hypothetical protein